MSEILRPSTLGEILDRTAQLYRRNFWLFAGVAALPIGVMLVLALPLGAIWGFYLGPLTSGHYELNGTLAIVIFAIVLIVIPIYIAVAVWSYAALTEAAASANRGEAITIRGALAAVKPRFWRYLWFALLQGFMIGLLPASGAALVIGILIAVAAAAGGGAASVAAGFVAVLVGIGAVVVIIWLGLSYSLGLPTCVIENKPAWAALQRAWKLSQGTRGRIFVLYLLIAALSTAVSMIAAIPSMIVLFIAAAQGSGAAQSSAAFIAAEVVRVLMDFVLQVLIAPVSAVALVLFYYDQRIRKEGFDIEWMMQQAGLTQPVPAEPLVDGASISGPVSPAGTVEEP